MIDINNNCHTNHFVIGFGEVYSKRNPLLFKYGK